MNGLEKKLEPEANVMRIDLWSELGKQIAGKYSVISAGTNLVLDVSGSEVYRHVGIPESSKIIELIEKE